MLLGMRRWITPAVVGIATVVIAGLGFAAPTPPTPAPTAPRVRVVQPNLGLEAREASDYDETSFRALLGLSGTPGAAPRLIVWPEGALGRSAEHTSELQSLMRISYAVFCWNNNKPYTNRAHISA